MKAIILEQAGEADNLKTAEIAVPEAEFNEVLVKVKAVSINPVDIKTRSGKALYASLKDHSPLILGWDISGEVVSAGKDVAKFEIGDQVFGMVNFPGHAKAYAEFVAAPANQLALKPVTVTHQQAAASSLAALTAFQVLVHQAKVQAGEKVLIHAAAGGVGHFAVQIAKTLGAYVIGTSSAANKDFVLDLGADEALDYTNIRFEEALSDIDFVFDAVGGDISARSLKVLKPGGRLIAIAGGITEDVKNEAEGKGITAFPYLVQSNGADMDELALLLDSGKMKPFVSKEFAFEDIAEAHKQIETGKTRGKLVITVEQE
ncbi:NADP-dependent oxidoreductase [Rubrolithibacter danxiaensis]|uniref:NADP-dependent oxidoreductase n=1 Tax=Rubrolithibacter danxiaensis TaxID=3390805 RepID=UPI003BF92709